MTNPEGKTIRQLSELNRICQIGPIGRWGAVESTFPLMFEEIVFNEDGTAAWTTESGMFPRETVSLRWRMERWGRLIIEETDEEDGEMHESTTEIGFKLVETEFGRNVLVMVTHGSDNFWLCSDSPTTPRPTFRHAVLASVRTVGGNYTIKKSVWFLAACNPTWMVVQHRCHDAAREPSSGLKRCNLKI